VKADGAFAGVVGLELVFVGFHGQRTGVQGAVIRGRAKGHKHLSVKKESGKLVADAFFGFGRHGLDGSPKRFESGSLVIAQRCKVLVDGLGFGCLDWWGSGWPFLVSSHCIEFSGLFVRYLWRTSNEPQTQPRLGEGSGVT
jgi:hypothetical protein